MHVERGVGPMNHDHCIEYILYRTLLLIDLTAAAGGAFIRFVFTPR